jgi:hypothetical protein
MPTYSTLSPPLFATVSVAPNCSVLLGKTARLDWNDTAKAWTGDIISDPFLINDPVWGPLTAYFALTLRLYCQDVNSNPRMFYDVLYVTSLDGYFQSFLCGQSENSATPPGSDYYPVETANCARPFWLQAEMIRDAAGLGFPFPGWTGDMVCGATNFPLTPPFGHCLYPLTIYVNE